MINLPYFFDLALTVDGETLDMRRSRVEGYVRRLDMRRAVLTREQTWRPRAGGKIRLRFERFISAARPHLACQRLILEADRDVEVTVVGGIDADVTTLQCELFGDVRFDRPAEHRLGCSLKTNLDETVEILTEMRPAYEPWSCDESPRHARLCTVLPLRAGRPATIEKRTALTTSRDLDRTTPRGELDVVIGLSFDDLLAEHAAVWAERWAASDMRIAGDDDSQRALRCSLYHLHRALVRGDSRVAIGAKGYAGELYHGLFFWDTEMYMLPFYLYTSPDEARTLCDYRIQSLSGAKRVAKGYGYRGARYAWTADPAGDECCGPWVFRETQIHATADVVYGLAHWARTACDETYVTGPAGETVLEAARYFLDRVDRIPGDETPHYLGVMGADEFTPLRADHHYTNRLIRFTMSLAADLGPALGATADEIAGFRRIAETLPLPRRDGLVLQSADFEQLAEIDIDALWRDRSIPFEWQVPRERIHHCRVLKQADVLLEMMLFPDEFTDAEVRQAWDFYEPITVHDSSLSAGVHAAIAARLGLADEAMRYWKHSVNLDLRHGHGGAREGIHIACCGANWQAAVFGFAGMRTAMQADALTLDPRLPADWEAMEFPIVWQRQPIRIRVTHDRTEITSSGDRSIEAIVSGHRRPVHPGETAVFEGTRKDHGGGFDGCHE